MTLDQYLQETGETSQQFAERSQIGSKQTVHNYRHGLRFPNPENLNRIKTASGGKVAWEDFMSQRVDAAKCAAPAEASV